jgi:hypothetical protein
MTEPAPAVPRGAPQEPVIASATADLPIAGDVAIAPPPLEFDAAPAPSAPAPAQLELPALRSTSPGEAFAAMIGIDDYPGHSSDLTSSVNDAEDVNLALHGFGVPAANRVVVRNTEASARTIRRAVQWLVDRSTPDSTVVLFYAGHVRKLDSDTEAIVGADGRLVTDRELADLLAPLQARRVWIVMASCFSGGFTEVLAPGRILTAASGPDSLAYENTSFNRSYLVEYLVRKGWIERHAGSSVQAAFGYAEASLRRDYPNRVPMQFDEVGEPLTFTSAPYQQVPDTPPTPTTTPPSGGGPPSGSPPKDCERSLVIFCRK